MVRSALLRGLSVAQPSRDSLEELPSAVQAGISVILFVGVEDDVEAVFEMVVLSPPYVWPSWPSFQRHDNIIDVCKSTRICRKLGPINCHLSIVMAYDNK